MAGTRGKGRGRISLLIDSPLRSLALAYRTLPSELRKQINRHTKTAAQPIWKTETAERATTRIQQRALVDTAKVGVDARNVYLRSASTGRLSSRAAAADVATAAEFGRPAAAPITSRSKTGKPYKRTTGRLFGPRERKGNVVHPAARDSIPRFAALWIQTTYRTLHELGEKVHGS